MSKLAPSDLPPFSERCQRCATLLKAHEGACPSCGERRIIARGQAANTPKLGLEEVGFDEADTLPPPPEDADRFMAAEEARRMPARRPPGSARFGEVDYEVASTGPDALWQLEVPGAPGPTRGLGAAGLGASSGPAAAGFGRHRLAITIGLVLLLFVLALAFDHFYLDMRSEASRQREFRDNLAQVQGALIRGDLQAARQGMDALDALNGQDPAVQKLREALDRQAAAPPATRRGDETASARAGTTPSSPRVDPAPSAMQAAPATPPPAIVAPATVVRLPDAPAKPPCADAMAALALCDKAAHSPSSSPEAMKP